MPSACTLAVSSLETSTSSCSILQYNRGISLLPQKPEAAFIMHLVALAVPPAEGVGCDRLLIAM